MELVIPYASSFDGLSFSRSTFSERSFSSFFIPSNNFACESRGVDESVVGLVDGDAWGVREREVMSMDRRVDFEAVRRSERRPCG